MDILTLATSGLRVSRRRNVRTARHGGASNGQSERSLEQLHGERGHVHGLLQLCLARLGHPVLLEETVHTDCTHTFDNVPSAVCPHKLAGFCALAGSGEAVPRSCRRVILALRPKETDTHGPKSRTNDHRNRDGVTSLCCGVVV